jgi:lipoate-protein ligase A
MPSLRVLQPTESLGADVDLSAGIDLLHAVRAAGGPETVRIYRPVPTLAFGQRDTRLPGFDTAATTAARMGFEPVVRKAGGRAAAYHEGTLIVDHVAVEADAMMHHRNRFTQFGEFFVRVFARLGVVAAVGEIPGEYCPGEYSVHGTRPDGTRIKLVGTAQRVIQGAWFFSSVVVVEDSAPIRQVLDEVYRAMEISMDPSTVGAADDLGVPGVTVETFKGALLAEYSEQYALDIV